MLIRANEIEKYMQLHDVEKVPLEAVVVDIPDVNYQKKAKLHTKRIVVFRVDERRSYRSEAPIIYLEYNDAEHKRRKVAVPSTFEFNVVTGQDGQKMLNELAQYESSLEGTFRQTVAKYTPEIQAKLNAAAELIKEAENIANEHSVPFRPESTIAGFKMSYIPKSFNEAFGNLDEDLVYELTHASGNDYSGWQTSQTC